MSNKKSSLWKKLHFFRPIEHSADNWSSLSYSDREQEQIYRCRWQHDKSVRTTHGVNCTGSCSWKVFVKDGIVTWETQQTDYPSTGSDMPEYEPRGCPRGATFSWYIYSPLRIRFPYVRDILLRYWRDALDNLKDPVMAWKSIVEDPEKSSLYKKARGKGGLVRSSWDEVNTIISASLLYTIQKYGPDRIFGFSPIPAMSMVSYAAGSRFLSLIGAPLISFYDWYADLPPSSPQIWGEQTDVPESSDWYSTSYMIIWGSNIPQTRTPDAHFMVEARYRGTKVVSVSPDYAEYVKFADHWLGIHPGTDGALAMAMTHVILKEFYVDQEVEYFSKYAKTFTDLPFLIILKKSDQHPGYTSDRFLRASDLGLEMSHGEWKPVIFDKITTNYIIPNGTIGHRWDTNSSWNLNMSGEDQTVDPALTILGMHDEILSVHFPYFGGEDGLITNRCVPVKKIIVGQTEYLITTVFDLMLANAGVGRNLPGDSPISYDDIKPYTPAWQEAITGLPKNEVAQIAREFAQSAIDTNGRCMIMMGAGINHWYNSDVTYRAILNLVLLTGCQGVNGGGWAHYVGQEKVRPLEGWQTVAFARDWGGPPRMQNGTSFMYFASEQWRYDEISMKDMISPLVAKPRYQHPADYNALAVRLGWLPNYPQFNKNSLDVVKEAEQAGAASSSEISAYLANQLKQGSLNFAIDDPSLQDNFPRVLFVWRANLIGSSAKGHEYFLKHLLGTHCGHLSEPSTTVKTEEINWGEIPNGKLDLLIDIDFRMCGTGLYSDILLPAATWYEKSDISSTDMHPFIHPFNPAITPPWQSRSDWDIFKSLAERFSALAPDYFKSSVKDVVSSPLLHDSPGEIAQKFGKVPDWKHGISMPTPGVNMPNFTIVKRDYTKVYDKMISLGPNVKESIGAKGLVWKADTEYELLKGMLGTGNQKTEYNNCPSLFTDRDVAEAILTLSSATNGTLALKAWKELERKTGVSLKDLTEERAEEHLTFSKITAQPRQVLTTPIFSGIETGNRRYSPFTQNVERGIPWRTLTGRQHFYLDHEIILEFGENLPLYRPPLPDKPFYPVDHRPEGKEKELALKYLTPHFKWSYHSTYGDTLPMLTLFRGGPHIWLNKDDAADLEIADNEWIEMFNRNGVVSARAVVSHRIPRGVVFMYHVQDRAINVPGTTITGDRGGTFNSPTRIFMKPTHMIGGYAQLSYGFNYYGPIGSQRDTVVFVRKLKEVNWLED
ncbi:nitrate reductase subunit alpha [Pelosinus sp. sgz500959]|uniref:nitrate reductase subunit alpha n=1 Tax=Pelosinus sp. sgz500959 TaxID=3242472 RepID=UPI00366EEE3C